MKSPDSIKEIQGHLTNAINVVYQFPQHYKEVQNVASAITRAMSMLHSLPVSRELRRYPLFQAVLWDMDFEGVKSVAHFWESEHIAEIQLYISNYLAKERRGGSLYTITWSMKKYANIDDWEAIG
jgi:hypothetical protein